MKIRVNPALAHRLFEQKFGGIENFVEEWRDVSQPMVGSDMSSRSVKTVYGWLNKGFPMNQDTLFSFFGALDVDPVALIDIDRSELRKNFGRLRQAIMLGGLNAGGFRPLFDLFRPSAGWPDSGLAQQYFRRDWTRFDFIHDAVAVKSTDVTITVRGDNSVPVSWPRAFHIAYRRQSNADGLWRPYGTVLSRFDEAILVHENGNIQRTEQPARTSHQLSFKTHFGPAPAEFRLASFHPFQSTVELFDDQNVPLLFVG